MPPSLVPRGGAHSLAREGLGESQFRRGDIHCGTLYIYVLCGVQYAGELTSVKLAYITLTKLTRGACQRNGRGKGGGEGGEGGRGWGGATTRTEVAH